MCISIFLGISASAKDISVYVDNELTTLRDPNGKAIAPFIQNGSTFVPVRSISQLLGCEVIWDGQNRNVYIYKENKPDGSTYRNESDDIKIFVDGEEIELKDATGAEIKVIAVNGSTYVPLRAVSTSLGAIIRWNGREKAVCLYINSIPEDGITLTENKPYELEGGSNLMVLTCYEDKGETISINNVKYSNSIYCYPCGNGASFNLDAKYSHISMTVGKIDNTDYDSPDIRSEITFVVDGKIVYIHTVDPNKNPEKIEVPLDYGLKLKIIFDDERKHNNVAFMTGLAEIRFLDK